MSLVNENVTPYCYVKMSSPCSKCLAEDMKANGSAPRVIARGTTGCARQDDPRFRGVLRWGGVRSLILRQLCRRGRRGRAVAGAIGARRPPGHEGEGGAGRRLGREHG